MDTTETTTEPTLKPASPVERLVVESVIVAVGVGTITVFALSAYGAIALTKDVTGYFKRRFGKVQNISSL